MSTTSVYFPEPLLSELEREAKRRHTTRNRLIVDACRALLGAGVTAWPASYLSAAHLSEGDRALLESRFQPWTAAVLSARRSRRRGPW